MSQSDRDYKYLAGGARTDAAPGAPASGALNYLARPAWRNQWFAILCALALAAIGVSVAVRGAGRIEPLFLQVALAGVGVAFLWLTAVILYRHYAWTYTIRGGTIESRRGIIGRDVQSIHVEDLRNVNVHQSIVQRLFNVGNVEFSSAGGAGVEVTFRGVVDPLAVKERVYRHGRTGD